MTFIDTSVLIAIMARETDADRWLSAVETADDLVTSPLVLVEATMRLSSLLKAHPAEVQRSVDAVLAQIGANVIPIEPVDTAFAIDAFARYGKGRGHPAQLNLADCLSYACARRLGARLLYKGDDFARTDLA